jgi:hypothetical protein
MSDVSGSGQSCAVANSHWCSASVSNTKVVIISTDRLKLLTTGHFIIGTLIHFGI